jgi:hypothetical protein
MAFPPLCSCFHALCPESPLCYGETTALSPQWDLCFCHWGQMASEGRVNIGLPVTKLCYLPEGLLPLRVRLGHFLKGGRTFYQVIQMKIKILELLELGSTRGDPNSHSYGPIFVEECGTLS